MVAADVPADVARSVRILTWLSSSAMRSSARCNAERSGNDVGEPHAIQGLVGADVVGRGCVKVRLVVVVVIIVDTCGPAQRPIGRRSRYQRWGGRSRRSADRNVSAGVEMPAHAAMTQSRTSLRSFPTKTKHTSKVKGRRSELLV
jgi:hypothetical protein